MGPSVLFPVSMGSSWCFRSRKSTVVFFLFLGGRRGPFPLQAKSDVSAVNFPLFWFKGVYFSCTTRIPFFFSVWSFPGCPDLFFQWFIRHSGGFESLVAGRASFFRCRPLRHPCPSCTLTVVTKVVATCIYVHLTPWAGVV